jgi:hypothetical protein
MSQLSLFNTEKKSAEPRPPNLPLIRKYLGRMLRTARNAEYMPWKEPEAKSLERRFPEIAALLGPEEGTPLATEFAAELERLRKAP